MNEYLESQSKQLQQMLMEDIMNYNKCKEELFEYCEIKFLSYFIFYFA